MISYKKLIDCSLHDVINAWNRGFEGYAVNVQMNIKQFLHRMTAEELCPERSLIAYDKQNPVGILLNGFRNMEDKVVAWNGGTAIAPEYRGKKIGSELVEQSLALYKDEGVHLATLEAIKGNTNAIKTYEKFGYKTVDMLQFYQHKGQQLLDKPQNEFNFSLSENPSAYAKSINYYNTDTAWQTQVDSIKDGRVIELLRNGTSSGYILFKESYTPTGELQSIVLYQSELNPVLRENGNDVFVHLLMELFNKLDHNGSMVGFNLSSENGIIELFEKCKFNLVLEQVRMKKSM
ncbi:hypothetical protein CIB95_06975 [Lottiidibacillus patelloidae]|uniref:N-acetyltransferase domain-containing protein n=1 Tax=Lottiidibacillus patelloidae TaxID=2670334 RepID=A0A263BUI2_9BACI|nr:GNAT family N-acetyltransferase [Lottiidibacillus patelloidae]OZM57202.1 hypothetical protein CIB95_06975 [Lottiidibacillus patelloidae]